MTKLRQKRVFAQDYTASGLGFKASLFDYKICTFIFGLDTFLTSSNKDFRRARDKNLG
jgi:hypothetical protein